MSLFPKLLQAPMAGVSTPEMAAAVSRNGGLGGIAVGQLSPAEAERAIATTRALQGDLRFNVNLFCHRPARVFPEVEREWLSHLGPTFAQFQAAPPEELSSPYASLSEQPELVEVVARARPAVASFHFGLPEPPVVQAFRQAGMILIASVTSLSEGERARRAGMDAVIAQGYEAGGHRGVFEPELSDQKLSTSVLTRLLVRRLDLPVIAAGGLMDGRGIAAVLDLGAVSAQLGTAYLACPESTAEPAHRRALLEGPGETVMTQAISGRPARSLRNRFTQLELSCKVPDYPRAYQAGKSLHAAAKARGESGFGAHWAGQGAPLARALPAAELTGLLYREMGEQAVGVTNLG